MSGSTIYSIGSSNITSIRTFNSSVQAYSSSLQYVISGNILYALNSSSNSYVDVKANLSAFTNFRIKNYVNQLVIYGFTSTSSTVGGKTVYSISQTIYIGTVSSFQYKSIQILQISSTNNPTSNIITMTSPALTKLHYQYISNSSLVVVFKQIDFIAQTVTDITFQSQSQYIITTGNLNAFTSKNYYLGEGYLAIRNDSSLTTTTNTNYV